MEIIPLALQLTNNWLPKITIMINRIYRGMIYFPELYFFLSFTLCVSTPYACSLSSHMIWYSCLVKQSRSSVFHRNSVAHWLRFTVHQLRLLFKQGLQGVEGSVFTLCLVDLKLLELFFYLKHHEKKKLGQELPPITWGWLWFSC